MKALVGFLIFVVFWSSIIVLRLKMEVDGQQRQIDQLCASIPHALGGDTFANCEYRDIKPGIYILYFADYSGLKAMFGIPRDGKIQYTLVHNIPSDVLRNWKKKQTITLLKTTSP